MTEVTKFELEELAEAKRRGYASVEEWYEEMDRARKLPKETQSDPLSGLIIRSYASWWQVKAVNRELQEHSVLVLNIKSRAISLT